MGGCHENTYKNKCNIKKRIGKMPPCMLHVIRTKNMDKTDGNNGHIWHARCAGQLALMQNNFTNIIRTKLTLNLLYKIHE